jgi:hypothetical protein
MFRLYVDEVGTDGLTHLEKDRHRYLSLSGVAMSLDDVPELVRNLDWIKATICQHDPDDPCVFHRTDIMGRNGIFQVLADEKRRDLFDKSVLRLVKATKFVLITAIIDKQAMLNKANWQNKQPYHYLMDILVEKYVQLLERKSTIGDIMPEARGTDQNRKLQGAYERARENGTYYVSARRMASALRAKNLKFRTKKSNVAGLQLCDLLAHPSHMIARELLRHEVSLGAFTTALKPILLEEKYDRSHLGKIIGYGIKFAS